MNPISQRLAKAKHAVVLTGAGMAAESGLSELRAGETKWANKDPMTISTLQCFENKRNVFEEYFQHLIETLQLAQPHVGYYLLAQWETKGLVKGVITQNTDGFHQDAGSQEVIELHGSLRRVRCHLCNKMDNSIVYVLPGGTVCSCGGGMRPDIVLFGEMAPNVGMRKADALVKQCDLLIVLGSNLQAHPANQMVYTAKRAGAYVIIVNQESTALDGVADVVIRNRSIAPWLQEVNSGLIF